MTPRRRTVLILTSLIFLAVGTGAYWLLRPNLPSYRNSALAREIQSGTTRRQVVKLLGDPICESNGWTLFTPSPVGNTIRAKFGPNGKIQAIDCGDGNVRDLTEQ